MRRHCGRGRHGPQNNLTRHILQFGARIHRDRRRTTGGGQRVGQHVDGGLQRFGIHQADAGIGGIVRLQRAGGPWRLLLLCCKLFIRNQLAATGLLHL